MKKILLFLFLSVCSCYSYSQNVRFGLGTSFTSLDWKYKYQYGGVEKQYEEPLWGYLFSAGIEYFKRQALSLSSDLLYYQSGGQYSSEELNTTDFTFISPERISVNYLSLGTGINFNPLHKKFQLQLSLGPRIDFLIGSKKKAPYDWIDKRGGLQKINYGVTAGIGLYYNLDNFIFGINSQYLNKIRKLAALEPETDGQISYGGVEAKEQTFLFGISFSYRLKTKASSISLTGKS